MTLTIENIPSELGAALRQSAIDQRKSVDEVAVDAMRAGLAMIGGTKMRDLSDLAGTWIEDPEFDAVMKEQDRIDPEMWP